MPIMRVVDPEKGHVAAVQLLSTGEWFRPRDRGVDGPELEAEVRDVVTLRMLPGRSEPYWS